MKSRELGIKITHEKLVEVEEIIIREEIASIQHDFENKKIVITTKLFNSQGEDIRREQHIAEGEAYVALDSINDYGDTIWGVIDDLRNSEPV